MPEARPVAAAPGPSSPLALALTFNRLALQGFGGVLPVAQRELVERLRWLSREQFLELLALAQVLPGPNVVNLALIYGDRCFGARGAWAALAGMLVGPLAVVLGLTLIAVQARDLPAVAGALRGMGVAAAALVLATALKLARPLKTSALGLPLVAGLVLATAVAVGALRWPLVAVVLCLGGAGWMLAWWRLGRPPSEAQR